MDEGGPNELARAFVGLVWEWAQWHAVEEHADVLRDRLLGHFGGEVRGLPVVSRALAGYQRVHFQVAIDVYLGAAERQRTTSRGRSSTSRSMSASGGSCASPPGCG